ncbi:hypothetical protein [Ulvibacterium sp.]|uniref:hypothetical protein n=1 Tax=Ulvibacterium sp. TaxID=2665914 RepID=UPI003BA8B5E8
MTSDVRENQSFIGILTAEIEEVLQWGKSADWSDHKFELLSEKMLEVTGKRVSYTTLKRIWGRVSYEATPRQSTLDILAQFVGHQHWLAYKEAKKSTSQRPIDRNLFRGFKKVFTTSSFLLVVKSSAVMLLLILLFYILKQASNRSFSEKDLVDVRFSVKKIAKGIPNTVVFAYDLGDLEADKIEIQQMWDERKRIEIEKDQSIAAMTYYYPGYYNAKLVLNDQIVRTQDLYITTDGWLGTQGSPDIDKPRYFLDDQLRQNGLLRIDSAQLDNSTTADKPQYLRFYYVSEFDVSSESFVMKTGFRNTYYGGQAICQNVVVFIKGTQGGIGLPFSISGCVGDIALGLNGKIIHGNKHDLTGFGCDFSTIQHLMVRVENGKIAITLNGNLIHENTITGFGKLIGITYTFLGNGEVDYVDFSTGEGNVFFEDNF